MTILVTGSKGFIGSAVTDRLNQSYTVIGHGQCSNKHEESDSFIKVDINSQSDWSNHLINVDTIIHLAAVAHNNSSNLSYINEVNVKGAVNLAQQAAKSGVRRFIFISSIGVLGNSTSTPYDESSIISPHSDYAESKALAEQKLLKISKETGLDVVIIRPVLVYGLGAPGNFAMLVNLVSKTPCLPFALCKNERSFISVDNLADFILTCIEHPKAKNQLFCISDGNDVSILEFTNEIAKGLNTRLKQIPVPLVLFKLIGKITGRDEQIGQLIGNLQVDISKAKKTLGWKPPFTMAETLKKL
jgi:nucleoside-diphosphate-sugar epimerase